MYISDYGYAANPNITSHWTKILYEYDGTPRDNDWLYSGTVEWTITRNSKDSERVFLIKSSGFLEDGGDVYTSYSVRPCFYLTSDAKIKEGEGSKEKPYRITFE